MIAIPNMSKPKHCGMCEFQDMCACILLREPIPINHNVLPDCPLIEIVTCGECKWYNPWHANYTNIDGNYCRYIDRPMKPTDFCSKGERRSNEH